MKRETLQFIICNPCVSLHEFKVDKTARIENFFFSRALLTFFTAELLQGVESHICQLQKKTSLSAYSSSTETPSTYIAHARIYSSSHNTVFLFFRLHIRHISSPRCLLLPASLYPLTSQCTLISFLTSQPFMLHASHMITQSPHFCYRCHTRSCWLGGKSALGRQMTTRE